MKHEDRDDREPYEKPQITQIELRPEEALVAGCKTNSSAGPNQASCTTPSACSTAGS